MLMRYCYFHVFNGLKHKYLRGTNNVLICIQYLSIMHIFLSFAFLFVKPKKGLWLWTEIDSQVIWLRFRNWVMGLHLVNFPLMSSWFSPCMSGDSESWSGGFLWQSLTNYKEANRLSALQLTSQMCFLLKYALLFCTSKTNSDKETFSNLWFADE